MQHLSFSKFTGQSPLMIFTGKYPQQIPTDDLIKLSKFVLQNNYFEFNGEVKQQISEIAIGTKFVPPYSCIVME